MRKRGSPQNLKPGRGWHRCSRRRTVHIPFGHPEGYYIAIANIYKSVIDTILKRKNGEVPTGEDLDFPDVDAGVSGVKFFHAVIESAQNNSKWVELD